ncbi:MAG: CBS domain-containing protein [Spirochaetota bacterium]
MELVQDILETKGHSVRTIGPDETVESALAKMADANVGALMVTDETGRIVGVFSERDFARRAVTHRDEVFLSPVRAFMTTRIRSVSAGTSIDTCMALMTTERIRHLPVVEDGHLNGVISIGDVVKAIVDEKDTVIEQLEHYISSSM